MAMIVNIHYISSALQDGVSREPRCVPHSCAVNAGIHGVAGGCCIVDFLAPPQSKSMFARWGLALPAPAPVVVYTPDSGGDRVRLVFSLLPKKIQWVRILSLLFFRGVVWPFV
ncbi:hypothetical protein C8J57DRAFT_1501387 [Mycena rebaudengoi]|nr:hypothetical protein C8J57DRAFT_1501387 [Mycena rebaudengoi]